MKNDDVTEKYEYKIDTKIIEQEQKTEIRITVRVIGTKYFSNKPLEVHLMRIWMEEKLEQCSLIVDSFYEHLV